MSDATDDYRKSTSHLIGVINLHSIITLGNHTRVTEITDFSTVAENLDLKS